jgi:hypothetical protein
MCMISRPFFCVHGYDVASRELQKVDMTLPPRKYRRCNISHHFFCVREDDVASQEVRKVQDITSIRLRARILRGIPGIAEYHNHSFACEKMPWHPMNHRRCVTSHHFTCVQYGSYESQKGCDISSFHMCAMSCHVRTQAFGQGCSPAFCRREAAWVFVCLFQCLPRLRITCFILHKRPGYGLRDVVDPEWVL